MREQKRCERCRKLINVDFEKGMKFKCYYCNNVLEYIEYEPVSKKIEPLKIKKGYIGLYNKLKHLGGLK